MMHRVMAGRAPGSSSSPGEFSRLGTSEPGRKSLIGCWSGTDFCSSAIVSLNDDMTYHTTLDIPERVPAEGMERATRAFLSVIDQANQLSLSELRAPDNQGAANRDIRIQP
jgi:hypothetical protein